MSKRRPPIFIPILLLLGVLGYLIVRHYREREIIPPGTLPGNGTIEATEVDVSALIPGRLTEVRVHEGDSVTTGETLVTLDPRDVVGGLTQAD